MEAQSEIAQLREAILLARRLPHTQWELRVRSTIEVLTDVMRAAGFPVESTIVRIKQVGRECGLGPSFDMTTHVAASADPRLEAAVRWCTARYYPAGG